MADHRAPEQGQSDAQPELQQELDDLQLLEQAQDQLEQDTRPEPVLTRARYVQLVTALAPIVWALLAAAGIEVTVDEGTALAAAVAAGGIVVAVVNFLWTRVQAHRLRDVVTPTASPRGVDGGQLISLAHARSLIGEAEAQAAVTGRARTLVVGQPAATPWSQDVTIIPQEAA